MSLDSSSLARISTCIENGALPHITAAFYRAQQEVVALMRTDSFRRFKLLPFWADFKKEVATYNRDFPFLLPPLSATFTAALTAGANAPTAAAGSGGAAGSAAAPKKEKSKSNSSGGNKLSCAVAQCNQPRFKNKYCATHANQFQAGQAGSGQSSAAAAPTTSTQPTKPQSTAPPTTTRAVSNATNTAPAPFNRQTSSTGSSSGGGGGSAAPPTKSGGGAPVTANVDNWTQPETRATAPSAAHDLLADLGLDDNAAERSASRKRKEEKLRAANAKAAKTMKPSKHQQTAAAAAAAQPKPVHVMSNVPRASAATDLLKDLGLDDDTHGSGGVDLLKEAGLLGPDDHHTPLPTAPKKPVEKKLALHQGSATVNILDESAACVKCTHTGPKCCRHRHLECIAGTCRHGPQYQFCCVKRKTLHPELEKYLSDQDDIKAAIEKEAKEKAQRAKLDRHKSTRTSLIPTGGTTGSAPTALIGAAGTHATTTGGAPPGHARQKSNVPLGSAAIAQATAAAVAAATASPPGVQRVLSSAQNNGGAGGRPTPIATTKPPPGAVAGTQPPLNTAKSNEPLSPGTPASPPGGAAVATGGAAAPAPVPHVNQKNRPDNSQSGRAGSRKRSGSGGGHGSRGAARRESGARGGGGGGDDKKRDDSPHSSQKSQGSGKSANSIPSLSLSEPPNVHAAGLGAALLELGYDGATGGPKDEKSARRAKEAAKCMFIAIEAERAAYYVFADIFVVCLCACFCSGSNGSTR